MHIFQLLVYDLCIFELHKEEKGQRETLHGHKRVTWNDVTVHLINMSEFLSKATMKFPSPRTEVNLLLGKCYSHKKVGIENIYLLLLVFLIAQTPFQVEIKCPFGSRVEHIYFPSMSNQISQYQKLYEPNVDLFVFLLLPFFLLFFFLLP